MALRLRIKSADGKTRDVLVQPGEVVPIHPGDSIVVLEPPRSALALARIDGNLVILVGGDAYTLDGFFPDIPTGPGGTELPPRMAEATSGGSSPAPTLQDADGQLFGTSDVPPVGGYNPTGGNGSLPESFSLPENSPAGFGPVTGGGNPLPPPPGPPPAEGPPQHAADFVGTLGTTFSITGGSAVEGGVIAFTITRTGALGPGSVDYHFTDLSAHSGTDFTGLDGTVSFGSGVATQTFTVSTTQDLLVEPAETFQVALSNPNAGALISASAGKALGTIIDDSPIFSVSPAAAVEGGAVVFTVTRAGGLHYPPLTVDFSTADGTAIDGVDYTGTAGTLTFAAGQTVQAVTVQTTQDTLFETDQTFTLNLTNSAAGTQIATPAVTGTILNDDPAPVISITGGAIGEGNPQVFTITRVGDSDTAETVTYSTAILGGDTGQPSDIVAATGTVTFAPGDAVKTVTISTVQDALFEPAETYSVVLSSPTNGAVLGTASAQGTILNDDPIPSFAIAAAAAVEGNILTFTVTRTGDAGNVQTVDFTTAPSGVGVGFAAAGVDYTAASGTLVFNQGDVTKSFTVSTVDDILQEPIEIFSVQLSNSVGGGNIATGTAVGAIIDNDVANYIVSSASAVEGAPITFVVTRTADNIVTQTVDFHSTLAAGNTASPGDFTAIAATGTLAFSPGVFSQTFTVATTDDATFESNETLTVELSNATNGSTIASGVASGTIVNNDAAPSFSIAPSSIAEGGAVVFTVTRSSLDVQPTQTVAFSTTIAGGDTAAGNDFTAANGTLTFVPGDLTHTFTVQTTADAVFENDETFTAVLSGATGGATITTASALGTIVNDDAEPTFSIATSSATEGSAVIFTVTRNLDAQAAQTVQFDVTVGGSASGGDFTPRSGILVFNAGQLSQTFTVATTQDTVFEGDETFTANLSNQNFGTIGTATALGTIVDDEAPPAFSIAPASANEGPPPVAGGLLSFVVTLSGTAQATQTVDFNTTLAVTDTASAGDFNPNAGTLVFLPGETSHTISVQALPDAVLEGDETFTVELSNAAPGGQSTIPPASASALGTIVNDEPEPSFAVAAASDTEGNAVTFTVTRTGDAQATETVQFNTTLAIGNSASISDFTAQAGTLVFTSGVTTQTFTVQTTQDALFEGDETFSVQLSNATGFATVPAAGASALGTIGNDEPPPSFAVASAAAAEGEGSVITFTVTRTGDAQATQTVNFNTTVNGTASASDFISTSGTLTFDTGVTSQTFTVQSTQDAVFELDETFGVELSVPTAGATIGTPSALGTIINDETPPSFSIADSSADEGGVITFTVTRTLDAQDTETVNFATTAGTANQGGPLSDYTGVTGTLTFNPGQLSQTFTVATVQDGLAEGNESFTATLNTPTFGAVIGTPTATGTIIDDDIPRYDVGAGFVSEGGVITFTVTRTIDSAFTQTVDFNTTLAAGTTASANDFTSVSGTLTFAPNVNELSNTFTVQTTTDATFELDETFTAAIGNAVGGPTGANIGTARALGTIVNDDATPSFSIAAASATEGSAVVFTVTRSSSAVQPQQTVTYNATLGGSASGSDFTVTSGVLTFNNGDLTHTFSVATVQDTVFEGDETFTAQISNATGGATITIASASGTIVDNEAVPNFSIAAASANEGSAIVFTVTRDVDAQATQTIQFNATLGGSAVANDFTATSGVLTFNQGQFTQTFTVATTQDAVFEGNETLTAQLSNPTGGATATITTASALGTIVNDDAAPTFSVAAASATEGSAIVFTVTRNVDAQAPQSIDFHTTLAAGNTASLPGDFTAVATTTLNFVAGQLSQTFTVQTTADAVFEANETLTVEIANATGGATIGTGSALGTINNDEAVPSFSVAAASATEGGTIVFTVTRSPDAQAPQSVDFHTTLAAGNSASAGDFTGVPTTTLNFVAGQTSQTFTVQTTQDTVFEGNETLTVQLSNAIGTATITGASATGTIVEDDAIPTYSVAAASANEGTAVVFTVSRSIDTQATQTIDFHSTLAVSDTASGGDFSSVASTLTFAPGQLTQTFTVASNQDTIFEGDETFTVQLANATPGAQSTIAPASATGVLGTIVNDDPVPTFSIAASSANEGSTMTFTVTRTNDAQVTQTVHYDTADSGSTFGFAVAGSDYTAASGTLIFNTGQLSQTFTVATIQDASSEGNEVFNATLSAPTGNATIVSATAVGTIIDDDIPRYDVNAASATEGGVVTFTVTRSLDASATQTVDFHTTLAAANTASAGDFTGVATSTLTFNPGQLSRSFTVQTTTDAIFELNETFTAEISNATGVPTPNIGAATALGTIVNDDPIPSFAIGGTTATEGGVLTFTVTRTGNAQPAQTVDFATSSGTATQGTDFAATSGTLTFALGQTSQTFTVASTQDALFEGNESFNVTLTNPTGGATIGTAGAIGDINDNDPVPTFSVASSSAIEGSAVTFTVSRSSDAQAAQTVQFDATLGGTATAGDFTARSGVLTFTTGVTTQTFTVATTADSVFEGDDTFSVQISNATAGATLGTASATGTISNDDAAPSLFIAAASATEGGVITFTATRTGDSEAAQTVHFDTTLGGSDTASASDFTGSSGTLSFTAGQTSRTFTVQTTQDALFEGNETFSATLSGANFGTIVTGTAAGTITNDDAIPNLSIAAASATEGGTITFTVTRSADAQATQTVDFFLLPGSATAGSDYTDTAGTLTFNTGQLTRTFTVATTPDSLFEANEQFTAVISGQNYGGITTSSAAGTIVNDDAVPTFSVAAAAATEGSAVTFTVTRSSDAQATQTVQFNATLGGTASANDFTATSGVLTFATGQTTQTFTVATTADTVFEGDETFTAQLSNPTAGATVVTATALGTISNDDAAPTFSIATSSATEGGVLTFTVTRNFDAQATQTVHFDTANSGVGIGFATAGTDYTAASGTLSFNPGQLSQTFTVSTVQDGLAEGNEVFNATLSTATGGATIVSATAAGTIIDDDIPTYSIAAASATEGTGITFTVTRTQDAGAGITQTVDYFTTIAAGNTATTGDFTGVTSTLTFDPGQPSQSFTVQAFADATFEVNETFTAEISNVVGAPQPNIGTASALGTIVNDDAVPTFSIAAASATEGSAVVFTVTRSSLTVEPTQTVDFHTTLGAGNTASVGDFTSLATTTLTFTNGQASQTFTVATAQDALFEPDETFTAQISNPTGGATITAGASALGTIVNDEALPTFSVAAAAATEGTAVVFTVTRNVDSQATETVDFNATVGGSAVGGDFTVRSGTLSFATGVLSQTFTVATTGDTVFEGDETFTVQLSNATPGVQSTIAPASAAGVLGTIVDNEAIPTYSVAASSATEGTAIVFTVTRNVDAQATQSVDFHTTLAAGNTATLPGDFTAVATTTLNFVAGQLSQTFTVQTTADAVFEADETFTVQLANATPGAQSTIAPASAAGVLGTIVNDEVVPSFSVAAASATEGGAIVFTVTRSPDAQAPQSVDFHTTLAAGNSASAGDFTGVATTTLNFVAGQTSQTFTVQTTQDTVFEGNETLTVQLSNAVGTATITGAAATGTIVEDDAIPTYSVAAASANEGTAVVFTVSRTIDSQATQTIDFHSTLAAGNTASAGDFSSVASTLTFNPGQLSRTFTVASNQDTVFEGDETFTVQLANATPGAQSTIAPASATGVLGTIVNDDPQPVYSIAAASAIEGNALPPPTPPPGGLLTFTVTRDRDAQATQTVNYATSDTAVGTGFAVDGVDYTGTTGTLTFNPGQLTRTFTVQAISDLIAEGNENFTVTLSNPTPGAGTLGTAVSTGIITDDDIPTYSIAAASGAEGNAITFTVTRTQLAGVTQTVDYFTTIAAGNTASVGDFTGVPTSTLTFAPGAFTQTFTVATTADTIFEGNETFTASITNVQGVVPGNINPAAQNVLGTINNDDPAPTFSIAPSSATEGSAVVFTVTRNLDSQATQTVSYVATLLGGDTASTGDFTSVANVLTFNPGSLSQQFTVATTQDTVFEPNETFSAVLSAPGGGATIGTGTAQGTIVNDDAAPTFSIATSSANEGSPVTFTVTRNFDSQATQTVQFNATVGGTASGSDFTATSGTLTFSPGQLTRTFTVATTADTVFEGDETFNAQISNPTGGATITSGASALGTIVNDDAAPTFSVAAAAATEGSNVVFTVSRNVDAQATQTVVFNATVGGTASAGDFTATSSTLTFSPGQLSQNVTVATVQDTVFEANETFTAQLSGATGGATIVTATALGTINNDDPVPSFTIATSSATEGSAIVFTVTRNFDSQATQTVQFNATLGGTASAGDFTATSGTLTFNQGQLTQTFTVATTNDTVFEGNETFTAQISNAIGGGTITSASAVGTIVDNEAVPTYSVSASSATEGSAIVFTVTRNVDAQAAQTVQFNATVGGTASASDFTAGSGTLTFNQGQLSQTFTVATTQDSIFEGNETLTVQLSNAAPVGQATIGTATALGTIVNDDPPPVFSIADTGAVEGGVLTFTVSMSSSITLTQTVDFFTAGGSAIEGTDYTAATGTLTFLPGQTAQTFTVATIQDAVQEANETFTASLTNAVGGAGISGTNGTATGTIVDDDTPAFSIGPASVAEGGVMTFTVTRTLDAASTQTVDFVTTIAATDSATGSDFTVRSGTLTFTTGVTSQTFTVATTNDAFFEPDETFTAELSNPQGGANLGLSSSALGTIVNNDAVPAFSVAAASATEGGVITFTVSRSGDALATQTVQFNATLGGTASAGDFTATSGILTFTQGVTTRTFTVATVQDALTEQPETFTAQLTNPTGGSTITTASAQGTINNDDSSNFAVAASSATEGGVITFTVTRTGDAQPTQTVSFNTTIAAGDTASATDFTSNSGTLTFTQGVNTATFAVATVQDSIVETNETFTVQLSNANPLAGITGPSAPGTIVNDDVGGGATSSINLIALNGASGFKMTGQFEVGAGSGVQAGFSVGAAGDVNGDGYADMIIGANGADPNFAGNSLANSGQAEVVFGGPSLSSASSPTLPGANTTNGFDLGALSGSKGFKINGTIFAEGLGNAVGGADLDGDGFSDAVALAKQGDGTHFNLAGIVAGDTTSNLATNFPGAGNTNGVNMDLATGSLGANLSTLGKNGGLSMSTAVVSNFTGNGTDSLLIGDTAAGATANAGRAYLVYGASMTALSSVTLDTGISGGTTVLKFTAGLSEFLGTSVAAADINGDHIPDLVIGAGQASGGAGAVYVVYGGSTLDALIASNSTSHILDTGFSLAGLNGTNGMRIAGPAGGAAGISVANAGDFNADGIADLVIGAPTSGTGKAYVIYGDANYGHGANPGALALGSLTAAQGLAVLTAAPVAQMGWSVSGGGDVNGDGYDDIVIGARSNNTAYVIYGNSTGNLTSQFNGTFTILAGNSNVDGRNALALVGAGGDSQGAVAVTGDVNGDSYADFALGSYTTTANGLANSGTVYEIYGGNLSGYSTAAIGSLAAPSTAPGDNTTVLGGPGDDVLSSGSHTGVVLRGGGGLDDTFIVNGSERQVAGNGLGTLRLFSESSGQALNLTNAVQHPSDQYTGIDTINMRGTGANALTLTAADVLDVSSHSHTLSVVGNSTDSVTSAGQGWLQGSDQTINAVTYHSYTIASSAAHLLVDTTILTQVIT